MSLALGAWRRIDQIPRGWGLRGSFDPQRQIDGLRRWALPTGPAKPDKWEQLGLATVRHILLARVPGLSSAQLGLSV